MHKKRNLIVAIMDDAMIDKINLIIAEYAINTFRYSSFMFFSKRPVDESNIVQEITLFQLCDTDEVSLNKRLEDLIDEMNALNTDFVLYDDDTNEILVAVEHMAKLFIRFDNIKTIPEGTFEKINQLKQLRSEYGYCKGYKPDFRPLEGISVENLKVCSEIIYLIADSEENLYKLNDQIREEVMEIDSDFIFDLKIF